MPAFRQIVSELQPQGQLSAGPKAQVLDISPLAQGAKEIVDERLQQEHQEQLLNSRTALNAWDFKRIYDPENGALTLKGRDSFDMPKVLLEDFDKEASRIADGVNDRTRPAVMAMIQARREQVSGLASRHVLREREVVREQDYSAGITSSLDRAAALAMQPPGERREKDIAAELLAGEILIRNHLKRPGAGVSEEVITAKVKDYTSAAHESVIKNMQQADPAAAQAYFEANKKAINATRWDEINRPLSAMSAALDGDKAAGAIWDVLGPKSDLQPVELDKMEAEARSKFAGDKLRMDAAISGLRQRREAFNFSERERAAGHTNDVFAMIDQGQRMPAIVRSAAWNALPEKDQRAIRLSLEQEAASRESRAAAAESRAYTAEQRRDRRALMMNADSYLADSDPAALAGMTRPQVAAMRTKYGFEGAQHLLNRWDALQKPGALAEAKIDQDEFNRLAEQAKLAPFDIRKSEAQKRDLGLLKAVVEQRIDAEQREAKRALTRPEKAKIMQEEIDNKVMVDVWGRDVSKSAFALSTDDVARAYVVVDGKEIKLSSIPVADRLQIMQARKKFGLPIGEADIAKAWVKSRASTGGATGRY